MQILESNPQNLRRQKHIMFGNILQLEIILKQRKGGAKNAGCIFCEKLFTGCSTARAAAQILARPVMGQIKTGVHACVAISKMDDDRRGALSPGGQSWRWWEYVFSLKSFMRHPTVIVRAKLVCSRAHPLKDQKQAGSCNH
jgi:hypothetical protein